MIWSKPYFHVKVRDFFIYDEIDAFFDVHI
jgi:hypothetical protein